MFLRFLIQLKSQRRFERQRTLTCVCVGGVHGGNGRAHRRVVEHGDLVVAGGEVRRVVVHVLDHEQDVGLTGPTPAVCRFHHEVELRVRLTIQSSPGEQLT